MTPEERELRRALEARSEEPGPEFRARLSGALQSGRPAVNAMPGLAAAMALVIALGSVGVLMMARGASRIAHQSPVSSARLSSPTPVTSPSPPSGLYLPQPAQLSAPSANVVWALYVGQGFLFRSYDRGNSWEQRALPSLSGGGAGQVSFVDDKQGWLLYPGVAASQCSAAGAEIWRTIDGAATWQRVAYVDQQNQESGIAFSQCKENASFVDSAHGFVAAGDGNYAATIYRTGDGGKTWAGSKLPDPPDFKTSGGFALRAGPVKRFGSTLYLQAWGQQGGAIPDRQYIFRSTDGGATWLWVMKIPSRYIAMVTESRWVQLVVPGQSMETVNSGQQWHPYSSDFNTDTPVGGPQVVFVDAQLGYAEGRGALQRTVDGGAHWERIATPGILAPNPTPPTVASSARTNPSPAALLPVSDPGFRCRLPVGSGSFGNPSDGGFVSVPRGSFEPDPAASMVVPAGQPWKVTSAQPVLKGSDGIAFDASFSRWVPATPEVISSDGSQYAWTERQAGGLLHVTKVADGSERTYAVGPANSFDSEGHFAPVPVPLAINQDAVFLTYGWEGEWSVWRLDLASRSLSKITGLASPSYGAGAIWLELTRGPNRVGMYSDGDTLARLDLKSDAVQDWFHRDNFVIRNLGFDLDGNPWVSAANFSSMGPQVFQIWRVRGPGQADLIHSGQRVSRVITDRRGTWFGNESGVYLYSGARVQRVSSASVGEVAGPCI